MTCDTWHVTRDMWHVTCDTWHVTWHVTRDLFGGVNILSNFQLPSSYSLWFMIFWRSGGKGWLTEWLNDEAVHRTAPATPGLLNALSYSRPSLLFVFQLTGDRTEGNRRGGFLETRAWSRLEPTITCPLYFGPTDIPTDLPTDLPTNRPTIRRTNRQELKSFCMAGSSSVWQQRRHDVLMMTFLLRKKILGFVETIFLNRVEETTGMR